jgi:hypothetical protein
MKLLLLCVALAFNLASAFMPAAAGQRAHAVRMSAEHFGRRELLTKLVGGAAIATALSAPSSVFAAETAEAVFAGGCFWCMEVSKNSFSLASSGNALRSSVQCSCCAVACIML